MINVKAKKMSDSGIKSIDTEKETENPEVTRLKKVIEQQEQRLEHMIKANQYKDFQVKAKDMAIEKLTHDNVSLKANEMYLAHQVQYFEKQLNKDTATETGTV